ncbi:dopamine N-acetyltransferase isoform X2 [Nilaparvata lugens]|uniref:dopamine N-acetyltransferase isoform X2 n=1 Tax=Nilaparvata lugens TaxID=108931 RepID=UPI000B97F6A4|nr:dopamine N-acetyltransferase isoform X2 [Nilaparvata lugens]
MGNVCYKVLYSCLVRGAGPAANEMRVVQTQGQKLQDKVNVLGQGQVETQGHRIVKISNKDGERVLQFLRKFFFMDEPLNIAVGLLDEPGSTCSELEQYCIDSIPDGVSFMAVNSRGEVIGICLNGVDVRGKSEDEDSKNFECTNPRFGKILGLLQDVGKQSDVFGQFPDVDRMLEVRIISVDDAYRGQGIAKALIEKTRLEGEKMGIPLMRVDCTSAFSAKAVARLGFHCVYTLQYADYLDKQGQRVFDPPSPHTCCKTFVRHLN